MNDTKSDQCRAGKDMRISSGQRVAISAVTVWFVVMLGGLLLSPDFRDWAGMGASVLGLGLSIVGLLLAISRPQTGFVVGIGRYRDASSCRCRGYSRSTCRCRSSSAMAWFGSSTPPDRRRRTRRPRGSSRERLRPGHHEIEHRRGQPTRERVLLTGVVRPEQAIAADLDFGPMPEPGSPAELMAHRPDGA